MDLLDVLKERCSTYDLQTVARADLSGLRLDSADEAVRALSPQQLRAISLAGNNLRSIAPLAALRGLKVVDLSGNGTLSSTAGLEGLALEELNLENCGISSLRELERLRGSKASLRSLWIGGNDIADQPAKLSVIRSAFPNLTSLDGQRPDLMEAVARLEREASAAAQQPPEPLPRAEPWLPADHDWFDLSPFKFQAPGQPMRGSGPSLGATRAEKAFEMEMSLHRKLTADAVAVAARFKEGDD